MLGFLFFFSSRRRHTRYWRDWSSDVCSSDLEFLAKNGAIMIGADNLTVEQTPTPDPVNFFPIHTYLLGEAGIPMLEMVTLEELAGEQVYEFAFFGACIKLRGATGAPMRPVAMPLSD